MLAYTGLGATETAPLWSMSTGGCSGGQFDTYCTPYSGAAGRAYNCVGCSKPNQGQIQALQQALSNLAQVFGAQATFGAGKSVVADKVIGFNTARAVGILGAIAMGKGHTPSPALSDVIAICNAQRAGLEAKSAGSHGVQVAIQSVAKHVPALFVYFSDALRKFGGALPTPPMPPPPDPGQPEVPVIDMDLGRRRRKMMLGGLLFVGVATTIVAVAHSQKRRRNV